MNKYLKAFTLATALGTASGEAALAHDDHPQQPEIEPSGAFIEALTTQAERETSRQERVIASFCSEFNSGVIEPIESALRSPANVTAELVEGEGNRGLAKLHPLMYTTDECRISVNQEEVFSFDGMDVIAMDYGYSISNPEERAERVLDSRNKRAAAAVLREFTPHEQRQILREFHDEMMGLSAADAGENAEAPSNAAGNNCHPYYDGYNCN